MVRVKICGITRVQDALDAVNAGADAVGFIFVAGSARQVTNDDARSIIKDLPPFVTAVGVFADAPRDEIMRTVEESGITCLQLHGDESVGETEGFPVPVYKGFRVGPGFDPAALGRYRTAAYLLDTRVDGVPGGTGRRFDWNIAVAAKRWGRIVLSGGINAANVGEALRVVRPYAIDVSSGVESSPGIKDPGKITALFEAIANVPAV